jgi:ATP/maltotriose-dependent transcriptional regulator MalT
VAYRGDTLFAAQESLRLGRWQEAREQLALVLAYQDSPEAHEGMGTALWWLGNVRESLSHRERAYAGYRVQQRLEEAVVIALDVAVCYLSNLDNLSAARGWIARAHRAVEQTNDERLSGWLWLMEGYTSDDPKAQRDLLSRAVDLARQCGDLDLELAALADLGLALVTSGEVADGLRLLDEAMAGTLGGECERLDTVVWASCSMLAACSLIGDQRRAAQWCAAAESFSETYGCPFLQSRCRAHYGRVLVAAGDWVLAETELAHALAMSAECGREPRIEALAGLAELKLRQGSVDEAARLLTEVGDWPQAALITAQVLAAQGHPDRALAVLKTQVSGMAGNEAVYPELTAGLVDAHLACGDIGQAEGAAGLLLNIPPQQHPQTIALAERANGLVASGRGEAGLAARRLRRAVAEFEELSLPFEAARTRHELARAVMGTDRSLAIVEASRALEELERLGAERDADQVAALLRELGVATKAGPRQAGLLSQRERDVLALLPRGLTNPEIAERLFISPKTVAHHVSSILAKLNLKTRTEAAAFAATYALMDNDTR